MCAFVDLDSLYFLGDDQFKGGGSLKLESSYLCEVGDHAEICNPTIKPSGGLIVRVPRKKGLILLMPAVKGVKCTALGPIYLNEWTPSFVPAFKGSARTTLGPKF